MIRLKKISDQYKRRTLRPLYTQTQATPYACLLSPSFDRTANLMTVGTTVGNTALNGKAAIWPGACAIKQVGEQVTLASSTESGGTTAGTTTQRAWGLFNNFVGGDLDDLGDRTEVGVWRGQGSTFEILAPAWNDTGLQTAAAADAGDTKAHEVYLGAGTDGRLVYNSSSNNPFSATNSAVARLITRGSANGIIVELLV